MTFFKREQLFYLLVSTTILVLLFTHPFMRYPYDIWEHLFIIDSHYDNLVNMPEVRKIWHKIWTFIFDIIDIENREILLRAKIIHSIQLVLSLTAVFIFARVVIRLIFTTIEKLTSNYMAYWATLIWLTIYATHSMHYHQVWILWYSVNYQITLPLFWYDMALILMVLFEVQKPLLKTFYILQITLLSLFILTIHPMEFLYLLMHLLVLTLLFIDRVVLFAKRHAVFLLAILSITLLVMQRLYSEKLPPIIQYLTIEKLPELYALILHNGEFLITNRLTRAYASFNDLMVLSLFVGMILFLYISIFLKKQKRESIDIRFYAYLLITSLFVLIPLFVWSAGFASVITKPEVVNRFYYSSSIFVLLPIALYYLLHYCLQTMNIQRYNISILAIIVVMFAYSKFYTKNQAYYKNIKSLEYSFDNKKVGFHLNKSDIEQIGEELQAYERQRDKSKKVLYLARGDIAMVLRYIYHAHVYWQGRSTNPSYQNMLEYQRMKATDASFKNQEIIIFETPKNFVKYEPYR